LHDLSVLHVVVILFTLYQLSANKHGWMDRWMDVLCVAYVLYNGIIMQLISHVYDLLTALQIILRL